MWKELEEYLIRCKNKTLAQRLREDYEPDYNLYIDDLNWWECEKEDINYEFNQAMSFIFD